MTFEYLEEFPVQMLAQLESLTGRRAPHGLLAISMEYGHNFSGPGKDVFFRDRSVGHTQDAWQSNFLHPVIYYYQHLPTGEPGTPDTHAQIPTQILCLFPSYFSMSLLCVSHALLTPLSPLSH